MDQVPWRSGANANPSAGCAGTAKEEQCLAWLGWRHSGRYLGTQGGLRACGEGSKFLLVMSSPSCCFSPELGWLKLDLPASFFPEESQPSLATLQLMATKGWGFLRAIASASAPKGGKHKGSVRLFPGLKRAREQDQSEDEETLAPGLAPGIEFVRISLPCRQLWGLG